VDDARLVRSGLNTSKTYGALRGRSEDWLLALLRRCVTAGWVDFTSGDRPVVLLTTAGKAVLFNTGPVRLLLPPEANARGSSRKPARQRVASRAPGPGLDQASAVLFEALRAKRLALARSEGVPPYVVASDRTLRELADVRPRSMSALLAVYGIGPAKAARYGKAWLEVVEKDATPL
jgi:ATP-dependent DNA helicase RecQ